MAAVVQNPEAFKSRDVKQIAKAASDVLDGFAGTGKPAKIFEALEKVDTPQEFEKFITDIETQFLAQIESYVPGATELQDLRHENKQLVQALSESVTANEFLKTQIVNLQSTGYDD